VPSSPRQTARRQKGEASMPACTRLISGSHPASTLKTPIHQTASFYQNADFPPPILSERSESKRPTLIPSSVATHPSPSTKCVKFPNEANPLCQIPPNPQPRRRISASTPQHPNQHQPTTSVEPGSLHRRFSAKRGRKPVENRSVWGRFGVGLGPLFTPLTCRAKIVNTTNRVTYANSQQSLAPPDSLFYAPSAPTHFGPARSERPTPAIRRAKVVQGRIDISRALV
jgi:hypothetical protein